MTIPDNGRRQAGQSVLTQVGRALAQARDRVFPAVQQPEGRSERVFRTLEDRLPNELKLVGITTMAATDRCLKVDDLHRQNARFAIARAQPGSAFVPVERREWHDVRAIQEERTVAADNHVAWTVAWKGARLHIPA